MDMSSCIHQCSPEAARAVQICIENEIRKLPGVHPDEYAPPWGRWADKWPEAFVACRQVYADWWSFGELREKNKRLIAKEEAADEALRELDELLKIVRRP